MAFDNHSNPLDNRVDSANKKLSDREIKGYSILAKGELPKVVNEEMFLVPSQNSNKKYKVILKKHWTCECPDFKYRKEKCKHIHAVEFLLKMRNKIDDTLPFDKETVNQSKCYYCNSLNIKKNGNRKIESGIKQRYFCRDCKKTFIQDEQFARVKANPKIITLTMDLYYKGLSLRDIKDTIYQFYGLDISHETIRNWINNFTEKANEYVKQFTPKVSEAWHIDEQAIKSKGKQKWMWNVLDENTRFLIANNVTNSRDINDARTVIRKSKEITNTIPRFVVTDGLNAYEDAIRKEFPTEQLKRKYSEYPRTVHVRLESLRKKPNNNLIERYHSTFRERDKVMRGFKGGETGISEGFRTYYNFIRPHMTLQTTPAQASGISLDLGRNRWLSLIKKSVENNGVRK